MNLPLLPSAGTLWFRYNYFAIVLVEIVLSFVLNFIFCCFQGFYQLMSENGQVRENYQMRKIFNNPSLLYRDGAIDEATYGLVAAKSEAFDPIFIDDV